MATEVLELRERMLRRGRRRCATEAWWWVVRFPNSLAPSVVVGEPDKVVGCVDTLYCVTSSSRQDTSLGTGSRKVSDGR